MEPTLNPATAIETTQSIALVDNFRFLAPPCTRSNELQLRPATHKHTSDDYGLPELNP
jgi:hypothetical protein